MSAAVINIVMMSVTVNTNYDSRMGRWEPDSRGRLEEAALNLYGKRGFENTTVEEITARAGLSERTFFRHFADKREVLFYEAAALQQLLVDAVVSAPASATPLDAVGSAFDAAGALLQERRDYARRRHAIIAASPELRERELIKLATLSTALATALRQRGVKDSAATLVGEVAIVVFKTAFERWVDSANERALPAVMRESFSELRTVISTS